MLIAACGGSPTSTQPQMAPMPAPAAAQERKIVRHVPTAPVDVLAALAQPRLDVGAIVPGPAQLVLGGTALQPIDESPLEVDLFEERGSDIHVGVRLDHARFALWTPRDRLLAVITHEQHISGSPRAELVTGDSPDVALRAGARVHRLARKGSWTQIRYVGAVEIEGWVRDAALGDRAPAGRGKGRRVPGRTPLLVTAGATIRSEQRWHARALAVAHHSMFIDELEALPDGWHKVSYGDTDVIVTGYLSKRGPPSPTRRPPEVVAMPPISTNATVPADTCLYVGDEAVGFIVGDQPALVQATSRVGWFTLTIDTPWGAVAFDARGPTETALATCAGAPP